MTSEPLIKVLQALSSSKSSSNSNSNSSKVIYGHTTNFKAVNCSLVVAYLKVTQQPKRMPTTAAAVTA